MSQKPDYTPEQQAAMLARAEEIGIHAAAKEYGIPWQTLTHMKRRVEKEAGQVPARAEKPKKAAAGKEKEKPDVSIETEEAGDDLKVENAILKEKIAKLEAKVKKLQKALAELIAD